MDTSNGFEALLTINDGDDYRLGSKESSKNEKVLCILKERGEWRGHTPNPPDE